MSTIMSTPVSTPATPFQGQAVLGAQAVPAAAGLPSTGGAGGAMTAATAAAAGAGTQGGAAMPAAAVSAAGVSTAAVSTAAVSTGAVPTAAVSTAGSATPAPFAQWLGRQADAAAEAPLQPALSSQAALPPGFAAALPAAVTAPGAAATPAPADAAVRPAADADQGQDSGTMQDNTLLAAMAMPLMPLTPMQIAQAVQIAQGGATAAGNNGGGSDGKTAAAAQPGAALGGVTAAGQDGGRRADLALPNLAIQPAPLQAQVQPGRQDDAGVRLAVQAAGTRAGANTGAYADAAGRDSNAAAQGSAPTAPAAALAAAPAAPANAQPAADSVKLAGPPTAWRQSLQEALGDRLHLQVGKNVEQAVIRLEPPQLGRIDIAIRHSNGTLEVNISATHGEVLRQLQAVGDNLRNDLAQRQYVDVAVSVTPAPKAGSAAPFGDPNQQQGRGRQPGRDQDNEQHAPGRALAEAGSTASAFSLGGREA